MAQQGVDLDRDQFCCSICQDVLTDPVTIPCGHSYCMGCITDCWDHDDQRWIYTCPLCRETFTPRPVLMKNNMLAEVMEQLRRQKELGVSQQKIDACTCLQQGVDLYRDQFCCSICQDVLKDPVTIPCGHSYCMGCIKTCWGHDDQRWIYTCPLCRETFKPRPYYKTIKKRTPRPVLKKNTIMAEVMEQLRLLAAPDHCDFCTGRERRVHQRVQREKRLKEAQQAVDSLNRSADKAMEDSGRIFTELIRSLQTRRSELKKVIRARKRTTVTRAEKLQKRLKQEIADLRRRGTELEQLSHTEDHIHFLQSHPPLSSPSESTDSPSIGVLPLLYFADVTEVVSELRDKLQDVLEEQWPRISTTVNAVNVLLPPEPKTRADFLQYSSEITLDPNTTHTRLSLSEGNTKATLMQQEQSYPNHPERFIEWQQVLGREGLTGRCYWEVEWSGGVHVAASYKDISRTGTGKNCVFGYNSKSWSLFCTQSDYLFLHNNENITVPGPRSSRIGVYLDHRAGTLSFYSVSDTMTLLHRVNTTFTQPLYPGLWLLGDYAKAEFCELAFTAPLTRGWDLN